MSGDPKDSKASPHAGTAPQPRDAARPDPARRGFLGKAGGLAAAAGGLGAVRSAEALTREPAQAAQAAKNGIEPFWGTQQGGHQGGITTPQQDHTYFAAFDLSTAKRADVMALLNAWTQAAARMTQGDTAAALSPNPETPPADSGEALGLTPSRLTLTFGFGPGLFSKDGVDRYGLAARRPAALVDLPRFNGDQLIPAKTGGDLCIQACANDAQVAFHAVRQLARMAYGVASIRWVQTGFLSSPALGGTPRNLMGFKDGTNNPSIKDGRAMDQFVWAGDEGPAWMKDGTYTVVRRIRITLEHWDQMEIGFQEQVVGRHKYSGAPLGKHKEFEAVDLNAKDADGNPLVPDNAHVRLSAAETNQGAQILRRGYSYNDGANFYVERWPPWRQEMEYDAGLLFVAHQRDPRTGFIKINQSLSMDIMNQFITHVGSGIFACPPGATEGSFIGAGLFEGLMT